MLKFNVVGTLLERDELVFFTEYLATTSSLSVCSRNALFIGSKEVDNPLFLLGKIFWLNGDSS